MLGFEEKEEERLIELIMKYIVKYTKI